MDSLCKLMHKVWTMHVNTEIKTWSCDSLIVDIVQSTVYIVPDGDCAGHISEA